MKDRIEMINMSMSFDCIVNKGAIGINCQEYKGKVASEVHPITHIVGVILPGDEKEGLPPMLVHMDNVFVINRD